MKKVRIELYVQLGKNGGRQDPNIWKGADPQLAHYLLTGEGGDQLTAPEDAKFPPLNTDEKVLLERLGCAELIPILDELRNSTE